ncbi:hypothetical protein [Pseudobacillus badius]|uniref:hypothetical protein n=1 Tax=Bacillus badius TaxID=1455 RepID=UPI0007B0A3DB|nr:hypothetical protein [Bacillus badius]KZN99237.1 hypothetical protein A4244_19495 [Bacillus badius]OCS84201.1 hypothetical protein A6M11_19510 [Bacillus badius]OVE46404.1 hypothetical protein B1A98_19550 [Bacillus badius]TDV97927.1 hypothetical protein B0G66_1321 [Bacillus badius]
MIPIRNSDLQILANEHLEAINQHLNNSRTKFTYDDINQWFRSNGSKLSFQEVILADMGQLPKIKNAYQASSITDEIKYIRDNLYSAYFANSSKFLIDTEYNAAKLVQKLGIVVCPYCNRNFINNVTYSNRGLKRTSQMDHYFCKEKYPFLAMSFYNLIPSCPSCNHIKSNKRVYLSPYDTRFNPSDLVNFNFRIKSIDFIQDESQLEITLTSLNKRINSNIGTFKLESQYQIHNDIAQELIKKMLIYPETKLNEIRTDFNELFINEDELKRTIFGNYLNENDFHKRPLAKFMSDIYRSINNLT